MQVLTAQYEAEQASKKAAHEEAALLEAEEASMAQADTKREDGKPPRSRRRLRLYFSLTPTISSGG